MEKSELRAAMEKIGELYPGYTVLLTNYDDLYGNLNYCCAAVEIQGEILADTRDMTDASRVREYIQNRVKKDAEMLKALNACVDEFETDQYKEIMDEINGG